MESCSCVISTCGCEFRVTSPHSGDHITAHWKRGRFYEIDALKRIRSFDRRGVYVDAGAFLGNHSIFFANMCRCTKLIAIEAVAPTFRCMKENVEANNLRGIPIETWNVAVHGTDGLLGYWCWHENTIRNLGGTRIRLGRSSGSSGSGGSGSGSGNGSRDGLVAEGFPETRKLDTILSKDDDIAVIKLDIEGYEPLAIAGAAETITRCRPIIVTEALDAAALETLQTAIKAFGYESEPEKLDGKNYAWHPLAVASSHTRTNV